MPIDFSTWTDKEEEEVGAGRLVTVTAVGNVLDVAPPLLAEMVPHHYASPERLAGLLERLGKSAAALYVRQRLPTNKTSRSGDLGEILAAEYIDAETAYSVPIKRLRWKDHRDMALRGDDVIAIKPPDADESVRFLKTEAKSRAALNADTVAGAREALDSHGGLPSPHALGFISDHLHETGNTALGDLIDRAQLEDGISSRQVENLLFVFSGNSPHGLLSNDLTAYEGTVLQQAVGLRVEPHQKLIAAIYDLVEAEHDP